jgi:hypothetical protein
MRDMVCGVNSGVARAVAGRIGHGGAGRGQLTVTHHLNRAPSPRPSRRHPECSNLEASEITSSSDTTSTARARHPSRHTRTCAKQTSRKTSRTCIRNAALISPQLHARSSEPASRTATDLPVPLSGTGRGPARVSSASSSRRCARDHGRVRTNGEERRAVVPVDRLVALGSRPVWCPQDSRSRRRDPA